MKVPTRTPMQASMAARLHIDSSKSCEVQRRSRPSGAVCSNLKVSGQQTSWVIYLQ